MPPTRRKAVAAGALLFAHALLVLAMDVYMGLSVGVTGIALFSSWTSTHDPGTAVAMLLAGLLQAAVLVGSVLACGFELLAGVRALQGNPRLLRPGALVAVAIALLWIPASLPGVSCVGALAWTFPLVIGAVALALAIEVASETAPPTEW